jgi:hypothetical protein
VGGPRWGQPRNISFRCGEPDADDSASSPRSALSWSGVAESTERQAPGRKDGGSLMNE